MRTLLTTQTRAEVQPPGALWDTLPEWLSVPPNLAPLHLGNCDQGKEPSGPCLQGRQDTAAHGTGFEELEKDLGSRYSSWTSACASPQNHHTGEPFL